MLLNVYFCFVKGADTAIGAGNKVKDLLNQKARQVKRGC